MKNTDFQKIVSDFVPPKQDLILIKDVVEYFKEKDYPIALRTLSKYATEEIIPKPLHIGNKAYYEKDFIIPELEALYVLKAVFQCSLKDLRELAKNPHTNLKEIVEVLHLSLKTIGRILGLDEKYVSVASLLANESPVKGLGRVYLTVLKEGKDPDVAKEKIIYAARAMK